MPISNNRNNNRDSLSSVRRDNVPETIAVGTASFVNQGQALRPNELEFIQRRRVATLGELPTEGSHYASVTVPVTEIDVAPNQLVSPTPSPSLQRHIERLARMSFGSFLEQEIEPASVEKKTNYGTIVIRGKIIKEIVTRRNRERVKPEKSLFSKSGGGVGAGKLKGITR